MAVVDRVVIARNPDRNRNKRLLVIDACRKAANYLRFTAGKAPNVIFTCLFADGSPKTTSLSGFGEIPGRVEEGWG